MNMDDEFGEGKVRCPSCRAEFVCGAGGPAPCWCSKMPHALPCGGEDAACFCPECLDEAIESAAAMRTNKTRPAE
jgi:hypothetical protein